MSVALQRYCIEVSDKQVGDICSIGTGVRLAAIDKIRFKNKMVGLSKIYECYSTEELVSNVGGHCEYLNIRN